MRRTVLLRSALGVGATALLLAGCAQAGGAGGSAADRTSGAAASSGADEAEYLCQGTPVPGAVLTDGATADQLTGRAATVLDSEEADRADPREWRVLTETDAEVYLVRELPEPRDLDGELRTHEIIGFEWMDETERGDEGWQLMRAGDCALRYDLGGLGDVIVALDPDNPPDPAASEIDLLVTETACAGGEPADGRVEVDHLAELEDRIEIVVGVRPQPGLHTCPSNPPTPFTLELDAPLGDRAIVDIAVFPERELTQAP